MTYVTGMALQSANDGPDRDPKSITLEGSNDDEITAYDTGNWQLITQIDDIPAWTGRFQTKELSFDNDKGFKHYRWVVLDTQGPSTCCFQIAEVELLETVPSVDVINARSALVTHEFGTVYTDVGATADSGETVTTSGTVDVNTVGTYTLTYSASDAAGNVATSVTRTATVVDTAAPVITLTGVGLGDT